MVANKRFQRVDQCIHRVDPGTKICNKGLQLQICAGKEEKKHTSEISSSFLKGFPVFQLQEKRL